MDVEAAEERRFPVEDVSWNDAQGFVLLVNEQAKEAGWVYRLPTEAEWEYACRGDPTGSQKDSGYDFYLEKPPNTLTPTEANFLGFKSRTCKVGSYAPNRLGLYDMHGNVWEWCADEIPTDPKDPKWASRRVARGGSWFNDSGACRAAYREGFVPSLRDVYRGLRLARVPVAGKAR